MSCGLSNPGGCGYISVKRTEVFSGSGEKFLNYLRTSPISQLKTVTMEFIPSQKTKVFARMEEDIDGDGLPLATRMYDASGSEATHINVTKHHKASGIPVVDEMDAVSQTPAGEVHSRTACTNSEVESP